MTKENHYGDAKLEFYDLPSDDDAHPFVCVFIQSDRDGAELILTFDGDGIRVDLPWPQLERIRDFMTFLLANRQWDAP